MKHHDFSAAFRAALDAMAAWSYAQEVPENDNKRMAIVRTVTLFCAVGLSLSACMNMPTQTSQITGSYTSGIKYEDYSCAKLSGEIDALARRENQLVVAQEQRIKTSQMQAFWWGFGQGDGIEASELANVRGEKEAARSAMDTNKCK